MLATTPREDVDKMAGAIQPALLSRKNKHAMVNSLFEGTTAPPTSESSFGRKMLEKLGWKEGEGLGKNKDGMKEHIRAKQRKEGLGLGASDREPSEWAPPPSKPAKNNSSDDSDSDDSSEDEAEAAVRRRLAGTSGVVPGMSDEELFAKCGGARLGMRARANQDGKLKRMEEADRKLRESKGGGGIGSSSGGGGSSAAVVATASALVGRKEEKKRKRAAEEAAAVAPSPKTRASPRLQAQALAASAVPEIGLDSSSEPAKKKKKEKKKEKDGSGESEKEAKAARKAAKAAKKAKKEAKAAKKAAKSGS